jgi:hypothetical protein
MIVTSRFFFSSMFIHKRSHWLTVGAVMHAPASMSMSLSTGINVRVSPTAFGLGSTRIIGAVRIR